MSIGIILHDLALGGTERIALRLAARWAGEGAQVTLFCGSATGMLKPLVSQSITLAEAKPSIRRSVGSRHRLGRAAATYFRARPVDICFVPGNFHWPVVPMLASLPMSTRPVIIAQISASIDKPQRGLFRQKLFEVRMRRLLRYADGLIGLSDRATSHANRIMAKPVARTIVLPALEDEMPSPVPVSNIARTIVAAGRLVPEKGFDTLIDAVAMLSDRSVNLAIVGAGPEEQRLRQRALRCGIAHRLEMPGYVPDIRPWLDRGRLFVLASHYEGYPAVMIEALAAGRQLVTTDCTPAASELPIAGHGGHVVPRGDARRMADALEAMLAAPAPDPNRLSAMMDRFRMGAVMAEYLGFFEELVDEREVKLADLPP